MARIVDHTDIHTAAALAQVTLLPVRPAGLLTQAGLRELLYRVPVHTALVKDQYVCVGGRGTLSLARRMLEPSATIPVVVRPAFVDSLLPESLFIEEVVLPILFRVGGEDLRRVIFAVLSVKSNEVGSNLITRVTKTALARIACVSVSWLRLWRRG